MAKRERRANRLPEGCLKPPSKPRSKSGVSWLTWVTPRTTVRIKPPTTAAMALRRKHQRDMKGLYSQIISDKILPEIMEWQNR